MPKTDETNTNLPEKGEILQNENALLAGLLAAAEYKEDYTPVEIKRNGKLLFSFHVRPLSEDEIIDCTRRATKMIANPAGRHLPKIEGDTDLVALRCHKILTATKEDEKEKVWNNAVLKQKLNCLSPLDVIDMLLKGGEKLAVCDLIDEISGYGNTIVTVEDYAKN